MSKKDLGWVILTAYTGPIWWRLDERTVFYTKKEAVKYWNSHYGCSECGGTPFARDFKAGFIKCVKIKEST